ncbi:MAG: NAD(P)H-hydrate dehydratase [Methylophaga sp.]|nr:NAD(P)H-hydrate dehydratase [Methylophaga sp.]
MPDLPHALYTAEQTRSLDRTASEQYDLPASVLMTRAGTAALTQLISKWPKTKHIVVICGAGNNGGDGFELARQALSEAIQPTVFQFGDEKVMSAEALAAREHCLAAGINIQPFENDIPECDLIVDALMGTGLNRPVEGALAQAIETINTASKQTAVLSLDIPSGLHADTGQALGCAVNATVTLSYIGLNVGLFTGEAADHCGQINFDSLGVPAAVYDEVPATANRLSLHQYQPQLAPRKRTAHKGLFGHLLVVGGDHGMSGAVRMAAEAGARIGSGLTSVATRTTHAPFVTMMRPEIMSHGVETAESIKPLLNAANAVTLGPGLGQRTWSRELFNQTIASSLPMVVDADALNLLSDAAEYHNNWILTPHPGEAARLLGSSTKAIQADRLAAIQELQKRYGGVVVLKGAGTLVCDGKAQIYLSDFGNPGMATGGMGDVLAGIIGGLLAQHFSLLDAACLGVVLHGMAADKATELDGERGLLAMDLLPHLRHLANLKH